MDRITHLHIENVRAFESLDLELGMPFTVLIGHNGTGKSTILECLEILRKVCESNFIHNLYTVHRGMPGLLRKGATSFSLAVQVEDDEGKQPGIAYRIELSDQGIVGEALGDGSEPVVLLRLGGTAHVRGAPIQYISSEPLLPQFARTDPMVARMFAVLSRIELHLGFDTTAHWVAASTRRPPTLRGPAILVPTERLELLGQNLANAWSALKNVDDAHWQATMQLVRLGLGEQVDAINVVPEGGAGYIGLSVKYGDLAAPVPAANLSDGQLAWLGYVAIARLHAGRSLLAIDEPELHLHPALLGRVIELLRNLEGGAPVILSTHSDRVLELLDDPVDALRVCTLEGSKARVARLDAEALPGWLERFGDLGKLREAGYLGRVLAGSEGASK